MPCLLLADHARQCQRRPAPLDHLKAHQMRSIAGNPAVASGVLDANALDQLQANRNY